MHAQVRVLQLSIILVFYSNFLDLLTIKNIKPEFTREDIYNIFSKYNLKNGLEIQKAMSEVAKTLKPGLDFRSTSFWGEFKKAWKAKVDAAKVAQTGGEKAVETGAQIIAPMQCERSVLKLTRPSDQERAQKRLAHWEGIVQAACEQCDRTVLASIEPIQTFETYLKSNPKPTLKLLLSPDATKSLYSVLIENAPQDVILMIGPEGGHTPEEEENARTAGYQIVSLGERVLRTETAGIVAITSVHSIWNPEMQNRLK